MFKSTAPVSQDIARLPSAYVHFQLYFPEIRAIVDLKQNSNCFSLSCSFLFIKTAKSNCFFQ